MTKQQLRYEINKSLTYHGEDGTSGYILSDKQLDAILDKVDRYVAEVIGPDEDPRTAPHEYLHSLARNNLRAEMRKRAGL